MTEERNALAQLYAACWKDEALKARFMSDPKAVLAEHGIDVPDNIDVNVVENSDNTVHITMPPPPTEAGELSMEELIDMAGGATTAGNYEYPSTTSYSAFKPNMDFLLGGDMHTT